MPQRPIPTTPEAVAADLSLFVAPGQVTELRALNVGRPGRTFAGWFDHAHLLRMAKLSLMFSREASGVYFIPNAIDPALLERCPNRAEEHRKSRYALTTDADIVGRNYLIVDLDTIRWWCPLDGARPLPRGSPATASEVVCTRRYAESDVIPNMADYGFAAPVVAISGNGVHLVYPVEFPASSPDAPDPGKLVLQSLAARRNSGATTVDTNTASPCRMLKVPGTMCRKGTPTSRRPHRRVRLWSVPSEWSNRLGRGDGGRATGIAGTAASADLRAA